MKTFWKDDLQTGQSLLEESKWRELLALCQQVGIKRTQFAILWMTAACALNDPQEIAKIIDVIRKNDTSDGVLQNEKLLSRLVGLMENTNHPEFVAELLLVMDQKLGWTPRDIKIAARILRIISATHGVLSADLLLAVGQKLGWQEAHLLRAERMAVRLVTEAPEKCALLLLAIHSKSGWTETQQALAREVSGHLEGTLAHAALQTALGQAATTQEKSSPAQVNSPFQFPDYHPRDISFVSPKDFIFEVYRSSANLERCEGRFRAFQKKFLPKLKAKKPSIMYVKDAFMNKQGQIWAKTGEILFNLGKEIPALQPSAFNTVKNGTAMLTGTKGIYHWMAETLPSTTWAFQPGAEEIKIAVPSEMPGFKRDTLRFAGIGEDRQVFVREEVCFFEELHFGWPSNSNLFFSQDFFNRFIQNARQEATVPPAEKIYISRKDSNRRVMQNEREFEKALKARGFTIAVLSEMSLANQITLFAQASTIVAPHGGGLTHLVFARPGTRVVEVVPAFDQISDRSIHLRFNYARICMMKGLKYHLFLEECHMTLHDWTASLGPILNLIDSLK